MSQDRQVAVRVGGQLIRYWSDYEVTSDMLQPGHPFKLTLNTLTRPIWDLVAPDAEVQILVDDVPIITGYIDDRIPSGDRNTGSRIAITGRDKSGRIVDESMPLMSFEGLGIKDLAERAVDPWFSSVVLSNAQNRRLLRGNVDPDDQDDGDDGIAAATNAKGKLRKSKVRVHPGQSRWQTLAAFAEEAEVIGWATADGKAFYIGQPNYQQSVKYKFFIPKAGSERAADGNVIRWSLADSIAERYSQIVACGTGAGTDDNYADAVVDYHGVASNGPGKYGVGKDFVRRKVLMVADGDVRSQDLAQTRAAREMAYRDATGRKLSLTVPGHSQLFAERRAGAPKRTPDAALFAIDTIAEVEIEELGIKENFLITTVTFRHSRDAGETTELALVPVGTVLRI